jgi:tetratricopeptide (TPR) repeat protein
MKVRLGLAVVLSVTLSAAAWADDKMDEARRLYEEAQTQYAVQHFDKAIELYTKAYELSNRPSMLFNIAQAYRLSNNPERAKYFYESYLRAVPDAENREEVEQRLVEIKAAIKAKETPAVAPVRYVRKPALRTAGIVAVAGGAVAIGFGIYFGLHAKDLSNQVDSATTTWTAELHQAESDGALANTLTYVLCGTGGALVVGGAIMLWAGRTRVVPETHAQIVPVIGPHGAGLVLQGAF